MALLQTLSRPRPGQQVEDHLSAALLRGLQDLLDEGCASGDWGDVRGSADGLIALAHCLGGDAYPVLRAASEQWLRQKAITHGDGASWEEEVWDTAIATLALCARPHENTVARAPALRWLKVAHARGHSNWNDEPWETMWALLALDAARRAGDHAALSGVALDETFAWLLSLFGPSGHMVSSHYTALFVLVANRFQDVAGAASADLAARKERAVAVLLEPMRRWATPRGSAIAVPEELWTRELWANSLVMWALGENGLVTHEQAGTEAVALWFHHQMCDGPDSAERGEVLTEDRAFACVALFHALVSLRSSLPEAAAVHRRLAGITDAGDAIGDATDLVGGSAGDTLRRELRERLERTRADYAPSLPLFQRRGAYYTANLKRRLVDAVAVLAATILLGWGAGESQTIEAALGSRGASILRAAVVLAGAFAMLIGALGISVGDLLTRSRKRQPAEDVR